ncbi:ribose-phosphate pyrophosphokinase [Hymenobacter sp. DG25A]|uniref:ribose-phosphate pyrophosphokinase n=1 Tax=Hymenobacter sp. DG25A TaxID=1385663 RepID=UPI0006BDA1F4|nr:ribose-phosphate pyrophosphokinase [Hymenobacter sp. DG25A]ALD20644.1 phosphoribosylpyrophosphate synthetase [Hymenobacter sp. DG25A]
MRPLLLALPGNEALTQELAYQLGTSLADYTLRSFPDGETYVQLHTPVAGRTLVLVCTLAQPNPQLVPLYFLAETARDLGARRVYLLAPYLAYMRQDARFQPGEGITSAYFARLLSGFLDGLLTVAPHLHRWHQLRDIYSMPTQALHATGPLAQYVRMQVTQPVLIGPDSESKQWVAAIAREAGCPFLVLNKQRHGDRSVKIAPPDVARFQHHTPVVVDDIISTARTMIATVQHLRRAGLPAPVCLGIHALFVGASYQELMAAGAGPVVTCNTVPHPSNAINLAPLLADALARLPG